MPHKRPASPGVFPLSPVQCATILSMIEPPKPEHPEAKSLGGWLKRNFLSTLMFVVVIAVMVALFIFQDKIARLQNWGYLGAFIISITANATVVLPMPGLIVLIPMGAAFNPLYIGLAAGVGGAIGEMTAYMAGYSGRGIWNDNKMYLRAHAWLKKWGILVVFMFAVTPLPLDVMGLAAGNLRFPAWKYFIACVPGKIIKYIVLAYSGKQFYHAYMNDAVFRANVNVTAVVAVSALVSVALALFLESWTWKRRQTR